MRGELHPLQGLRLPAAARFVARAGHPRLLRWRRRAGAGGGGLLLRRGAQGRAGDARQQQPRRCRPRHRRDHRRDVALHGRRAQRVDGRGVNKREAKEMVELFFEEIRSSLENNEEVKLSGFGNFDIRDKKSRPGRNPKTGEEVAVTARRVVTFKPGQKLKARVDGHAGGK